MIHCTSIIKRITNKLTYGVLFPIKKEDPDFYISEVSPYYPWVYISYISGPFYHQNDEDYLNSHQNKKEALAQVNAFHELGYNVYVQDYLSNNDIPDIKFDIVFGHDPNFVRASIKNPQALKIHYVPGAFIDHRNSQIVEITDYVNARYNSTIPYRRLLTFENMDYSAKQAYEIADYILLIGSKFTIATFPEYLRSKITTIHQSTQAINVSTNPEYSEKNEFFFMGSYGNLLKGISLLIEYFSLHKEYTINIVGPIEEDVRDAFKEKITENIILHGYQDINGAEINKIISNCNFIIYPSGSEGMPGAVLNSMKYGLIPIVTPWAAFDEIEDYGYVLQKWNTDSINEGVKWALSLSPQNITARKQRCIEYVTKTYSIDNYKTEFKHLMCEWIKSKAV